MWLLALHPPLHCLAVLSPASSQYCYLRTLYVYTPDVIATMAAEDANLNDGSRLLIVSNRLPLTIKRSDDGHYDFSMSSGGLVTGLSGLSKTMTYEWYGWPGLQVPEAEVSDMKEKLKQECDAHPVFIDDDLADKHYNGFSSTYALSSCSVLY